MIRDRKMSRAERQALVWLHDNGGQATIDPYGRIRAHGNWCGSQAQTFLRLVARGYVAAGILDIGITLDGLVAVKAGV